MSDFASTLWPHNPVIQGLLQFIFVLFLLGLVLSLRAYQQLRRERTAAAQLLAKKVVLLDRPSLPMTLGPNASRLAGQLLTAMLDQRGLAFARPADVLDPLLEGVHRITASARTIPNLLLLSGLISTVVGLAFTLQSLAPQIQGAINSGEPETVARSLGVTLQEMGGAFAGTLWGVTAAFVLQALNAVSTVQAERLSGDLDRVALRFAPDVYPASSEQQLASLRDLIQRSEEFLSVTQQKISETSERFAVVLTDAGSVIETSLKTLQSTSTKISEALMTASGDVRQSSEQLSRAARAIKEHQQDFRNIYTSFNEMFERSMKALQLHSDQELGEIRALQKEFGLTGAQIVGEIFKTSEKFGSLSEDLAHVGDAFLSGTQDVNTTIKAGFDRLDTELGKTLGAYTTEVHAVSSQLGQLDQRFASMQTATGSLERTLRAKDEAEHTRLRDQMGRVQALTAALGQVSADLEQLKPIMAELRGQTGEPLSRSGGQSGQDESTVQLHRQAVETNLLLTGVLDQLSRQADRLASQVDGQGQLQGALEQHRQAGERLHQVLEALPGQLRLAELERRQGELITALERLLGTLNFAMAQPAAEGPAA